MRSLLRGSLAALVLVSACAETDGSDPSTAMSSDSLAARTVHRMPRGGTSTVNVRTLANARCLLGVIGQPAMPGDRLELFSDDQGMARVQLDHLDTTVDKGELALECTDEAGARAAQSIHVVIDDTATPELPARYRTEGLPTLARLDVPASSLTAADLHARHYPPVPGAAAAPAELAAWNRLVASGAAIITPHIVDDHRFQSVSATSGNWSGYVVTTPSSAPIYAWIYGEWNVPRVYAESGFWSNDYSSFWVGIDGWGSGDVVQDGTAQNTHTAFWIQTTAYSAWIEWFPLSSQTVSNFPVSPGDRIHAWTWVTDASGNYSTNVTRGWFYLWNETRNVYVYTSLDIPAGTTFDGHAAEWVMERPTVSGSVSRLANYYTAQMTNALVYDLWGGAHRYGGDASNTSWNVTMTGGGGNALSSVYPVDYATMQFWYRAHQ